MEIAKAEASSFIRRAAGAGPVERAAQTTGKHFVDKYDGVADQVQQWGQSRAFEVLLERARRGEPVDLPRVAVGSFVEESGFDSGENRSTEEEAAAVLRYFLEELKRELYGPGTVAVMQHVDAKFEDLERRTLPKLLGTDEQHGGPIPGYEEWQVRLDVVKRMLTRGHLDSAQEMLSDIQKEVEEKGIDLPATLRFRLDTNLGAVYLHNDCLEHAAEAFVRAFEHENDSARALAHRAYAELIRDNPAGASAYVEMALRKDPDHDVALATLAHTLEAQGRDAEATQLWDKASLEKPELLVALCYVELSKREYDRVEAKLSGYQVDACESPRLGVAHAHALLGPLIEVYRADHPPSDAIPEAHLSRLRNALAILDSVLEPDSAPLPLESRVQALSLRGLALSALGRRDQAISDWERLLAMRPNDPPTLHNLFVAYLSADREGAAEGAFLQLPTEQRDLPVVLAYCELLVSQGRTDKAAGWLAPLERDSPNGSEERDLIAATRAVLIAELEGNDAAVGFLDAELRRCGVSAVAWAYLGELQARCGNFEGAIQAFDTALARATGNTRMRIERAFAGLLAARGEVRRAAEIAQGLAQRTNSERDWDMYVWCLYEAREFPAIHQAIDDLTRLGVPQTATVREVRARLAIFEGDLASARSQFEALARDYPAQAFEVDVAIIHVRLGNFEAAVRVVSRMEMGSLEGRALLRAISVLNVSGRQDLALPYAYAALRERFTDPEVHHLYLAVFFAAEREGRIRDPKVVEVGTAVRLQMDLGARWVSILSDPKPYLLGSEFGPDHPASKALLGLAVGDEVYLPNGEADGSTAVLVEIQDKFVRAFQDVITDYRSRFPEDKSLQKYTADLDSLNPLGGVLEHVVQRNDVVTRALENYRSDVLLTVGSVANATRQSYFAVCEAFIADRALALDSTTHAPSELSSGEALVAHPGAVVELTSLMLLHWLGLGEAFARTLGPLYVPQATVDLLRQELQDFRQEEQQAGTLTMHDGRLVMHDSDQQDLHARRRLREELLEFVTSRCRIVPVRALTRRPANELEALSTLWSDSAYGSVLAAQERGLPLVSDDRKLRAWAENLFQVSNVSSLVLLGVLQRKQQLAGFDYHAIAIELARMNVQVPWITFETLQRAMNESGYVVTEDVRCLLSALAQPRVSARYATGVLVRLLKDVFVVGRPAISRLAWVEACLDCLCEHRTLQDVMPLVRGFISHHFELLPLHEREAVRLVEAWYARRLRT
ncbi:MAG: BTAD domain-containing putative transcriptional regulator [Trueperaceae bacterium]|nr:BTAD domain-containing putative transcriptional regulator [Trueperaceae bacterium]